MSCWSKLKYLDQWYFEQSYFEKLYFAHFYFKQCISNFEQFTVCLLKTWNGGVNRLRKS